MAAAGVSLLVSVLLMIFGNGMQILCGFASVLLFSICSLVSMALDISELDDKIEKLNDSFENFVALFPKPQSVQEHIQNVLERIPYSTKADIKKQQLKNDFLLHKSTEPQCSRYINGDSLPNEKDEVSSEDRKKIEEIEKEQLRNFMLRRKDIEHRIDAKIPSGAECTEPIGTTASDIKDDVKGDVAADKKVDPLYDVKERPAAETESDADDMLNEKAPVENAMDADADESNETSDK